MLNKGLLKQIILYTTLISVFSENIYYRTSIDEIDIRFYYFVYVVNLAIFLLILKKISLNKYHVGILLLLTLSGVIGTIREPAIISKFVLSIFGIGLCSIYYYIFIQNIGLSYKKLFEIYIKISFWVALHAFVKLIIYVFILNQFPSEYGIFTEPAHYCVVLLPACFYYFKNMILEKKIYVKGLIVLLSVLLSASSLGIIGFLAMLPLMFKKIKFSYILISIVLASSLAVVLYYSFDKFNDRVAAASLLLQDGVGSGEAPNQSSFSWVSNFLVSLESCKETYGFGNGLGSHHTYYFKYVGIVMPGVEKLGEDYYGMNSRDASGLFNRVLSDLGIWGILFIVLFINRFFIKGQSIYAIISNAILIAFITRLVRDGMYFTPDLYFFVWGYYFIYKEYKQLNEFEKESYY